MTDFLEKINSYVWGSGLIFLLMTTGIIYTIKLKFVQFRIIPFFIKNPPDKKQFRTVCMALGTAMGTGNITGVASAIAVGGAGSVFWMWVSAFFGMALVYAENTLSMTYSTKDIKGTMAYISRGLGSPVLAGIFAVFCVMACIGMGGMVQVNTFSGSLETLHINKFIIAAFAFVMIFLVTSGGAERIGKTAQLLLPIVSVSYMAVCVIVLVVFRKNIPEALGEIFGQAFGIRQFVGGISGYTVSRAVSTGIRRGIFSNEAGLGSSPILHSSAENTSPEVQSMWSMAEVFFDTMICCTLTALAVICATEDFSVQTAFSAVTGKFSVPFLAVSMAVFAFCTVIGWYYCGETAFCHLSGGKYKKIFCIIFSLLASSGAVLTMKTVWTLSDIFNGLMAFPNLVGLILLMNKVKINVNK
ncbi:MAG: amino acid carrier protein [Muribaculaceae bacterium]|nr:amino acid carrier protein [Alistipes senegalensis]MCM1474327.1 amino acid carrier protein [Muribaculaceae bacterium]